MFAVVFAFPLSILSDPPAKHPKTGEPLMIDCLRGTPSSLDGKLNDWQLNYMTPAILDTEEQIYAGVAPGAASWDGAKDSSGKIYVMWDDRYVYVAAVMLDDNLSNNKAGGDIWNGDAVEVFFSEPVAAATTGTEHYQYGFNYKGLKWNWCNMEGAGQKEPNYVKTTATETNNGYNIEASIEYSNMKSLTFKAGEVLGFHAVLDDTDAADRELQMTWTSREAHDQTQGFGQVTLSSENAAVNPGGKMALIWGMVKK